MSSLVMGDFHSPTEASVMATADLAFCLVALCGLLCTLHKADKQYLYLICSNSILEAIVEKP